MKCAIKGVSVNVIMFMYFFFIQIADGSNISNEELETLNERIEELEIELQKKYCP